MIRVKKKLSLVIYVNILYDKKYDFFTLKRAATFVRVNTSHSLEKSELSVTLCIHII